VKRVVIVGVGALGSHLVLFGRGWAARLVVIDPDRVEQKNVASQFHTRMGVGRNKAKALQQAMQGLFGARLEAIPHRLAEDNARTLLEGADLVVDCVDHGPTRRLLAEVSAELGVPCLHGALAADGAYGRVMWAPRFDVDHGGEGEATCEDGEHLPFVALVAAKMAGTVRRFLEDGVEIDTHLRPDGMEQV
jgi:molybdopterin/thiamine biosynthesis adenylyltransferase